MAYGQNQIEFDQRATDAFGRGRVSEPQTLFNVSFQYDAQPLLMQVLNVGAGTGVKTTNVSSVTLATGDNTSGDGSILQSKGYYRYEPGKSQFICMTGIIGAVKANVRAQIGYYDVNDGVFFDNNNGVMNVTVRTHTSGSPVDTAVAQASWNLDKMDGTGASGITLDFTKTQIFIIDMEWLGVGRVRFGFNVAGVTYYCHQVLNANVLTLPYMNTANLPLRWEIHNTGTAAGTTSMTAICGSIVSEGGAQSPVALRFGVGNATMIASISSRVALLTIRPKTTFNSITNRTRVSIFDVDIYNNDGTTGGYWELLLNTTLGGSPVYNSVDANSGVEFDVAGTTCTGGTVVAAGTCPPAHQSTETVLDSKWPLTLDIAGTGQDTLTLAVRAYTGSISNAAGAMRWKEER